MQAGLNMEKAAVVNSMTSRPEAGEAAGTASQDPAADFGLPSMLDLTAASGLRAALGPLLKQRLIQIDASQVERMSTPCVQVLLSAAGSADAAKAQFRIVEASEAFRSAISELGLQSEFSRWMA